MMCMTFYTTKARGSESRPTWPRETMVATLDGYRRLITLAPTIGSSTRLQLLKLDIGGAARMESAQTTTIVLVALPAVVERVRRRSTSVGACLVGGAGRALTTGRAHKDVHLCILSYLRLGTRVMLILSTGH